MNVSKHSLNDEKSSNVWHTHNKRVANEMKPFVILVGKQLDFEVVLNAHRALFSLCSIICFVLKRFVPLH